MKLKQALATANLAIPKLTFYPEEWLPGGGSLLLWEAFVSGKAKSKSQHDSHRTDARAALKAFLEIAAAGAWNKARTVKPAKQSDALNLAAFAASWSGWIVTDAQFRQPTIVVKP